MKVAIVYNRVSQRVINLFGLPNREKYGLKNIHRIRDALRQGGHQVEAFEGDKDLIDRLEEFMPRVLKQERPGMVFNLSYGIQGQARYTHVPGMLEMIGLPYVGSGPLAHSLSLDKVVSKMIFVQNGLPTPGFAVLQEPGFEMPELKFPLIVKPKNEAVSFGIQICRSEKELREAAGAIFTEFSQPVLVEQYIAGREINVGILGNNPAEALPPAEIIFGKTGPQIYTYEDKTRKSGREITVECPAQLDETTSRQAQQIAQQAFHVLGCYDCCRVDMRLDKEGNLYILEVNSLPSLGEHGSYTQGAAAVGLDFTALVNRLVDVAAARYFGMSAPPEITSTKAGVDDRVAGFLSSQRDAVERQLKDWVHCRSRTSDPVGLQEAFETVDKSIRDIGLKSMPELTEPRIARTWQTKAGLEGGTLLIGHLDVPLDPEVATQTYRREPEWLYGEGIGSSRAPLVSLLFSIRALRHVRSLQRTPLGVLLYCDEGLDCRYSAELIQKAAARAKHVLVLRPGNEGNCLVNARRGQRRFRLVVEGEPLRLGQASRKPDVLTVVFDKLKQCMALNSRKDRVAVAALDLRTRHLPMLLPHGLTSTLLLSYPDEKVADGLESQFREILKHKGLQFRLNLISTRPPMKERRANARLLKALENVAAAWDIPLRHESSVWPSAAGLVPASTGAVCGVGPVARNVYTPQESVDRVSLLQRTILLAEFLVRESSR